MSLQELFNFYVFTPGRAAFSVGLVQKVATGPGEALIATACAETIALAGKALDVEQTWSKSRAVVSGKRAKAPALDAQIDRTLSAIAAMLDGLVSALPADAPLARDALLVKNEVFAGGVAALTSLPYEDELGATQSFIRRTTGNGDLAAVAARLQLRPLLDRLQDLVGQFQEVLAEPATREASYEQVTAARVATQEKLLQVVARILGTYPTESPTDVTARARLLSPILDQNARIGQSMRRRSTVVDVDPTTGEERPTPPATPPAAT